MKDRKGTRARGHSTRAFDCPVHTNAQCLVIKKAYC